MSLNVQVVCPHCDSVLASENITYNMGPVYYRVLRSVGLGREGLRGLDERRVGDVSHEVGLALDALIKYEHRFRVMEPSNGWGSVNCVRRVLAMIYGADRSGIIRVY